MQFHRNCCEYARAPGGEARTKKGTGTTSRQAFRGHRPLAIGRRTHRQMNTRCCSSQCRSSPTPRATLLQTGAGLRRQTCAHISFVHTQSLPCRHALQNKGTGPKPVLNVTEFRCTKFGPKWRPIFGPKKTPQKRPHNNVTHSGVTCLCGLFLGGSLGQKYEPKNKPSDRVLSAYRNAPESPSGVQPYGQKHWFVPCLGVVSRPVCGPCAVRGREARATGHTSALVHRFRDVHDVRVFLQPVLVTLGHLLLVHRPHVRRDDELDPPKPHAVAVAAGGLGFSHLGSA